MDNSDDVWPRNVPNQDSDLLEGLRALKLALRPPRAPEEARSSHRAELNGCRRQGKEIPVCGVEMTVVHVPTVQRERMLI